MAAKPRLKAEDMVSDPTWFFYNFSAGKRELTLLSMNEQDYRDSLFMDKRVSSSEELKFNAAFHVMARVFEKLGRAPAATAYIFHMGHCGSTLLSRALSASERVLPLREPASFFDLSRLYLEIDDPVCMVSPEDWDRLCHLLLHSYARTFRPEQKALVKATSTNNALIDKVLEEVPEATAVLLYQPLRVQIAALFKRDRYAADIIFQAWDRMRAWQKIEDAPQLRNWQLSPLQMAVVSWLTSMRAFEAVQRKHPERVRLVMFDEFLAEPQDSLVEANRFLGLDQDPERLLENYAGVSQEYSKRPGRAFTPDDHEKMMDASLKNNAGKIERGTRFASQLIDAAPSLEPLRAHLE